MIRSVRILGGGRSFSGFTLFNDPDDGGAVDAATGGRALEELLSFSEIALYEEGRRAGDVIKRHLVVETAVVTSPDRLKSGVDDEPEDEIASCGVLRDCVDKT